MGTRRSISGNDILLQIDPAGGTNYILLVCLNSNSLESTTSVIDAGSKCGPNKLPGTLDNKANLEIIDVLDTSNGEISSDVLFTLQQAKTIVSWKHGKVVPAAGDVTYTGTGFIAGWNNNASKDAAVTTTCTLEITGNITQTRTGS